MARRGKTLAFAPDELDDLVELSYGEARAFALLTLVFETVDTSKALHMDHIFPISLFKRRKLLSEGISEEKVDDIIESANTLPNLQLIEGAINQEKLTALPAKWLRDREPDLSRREKYIFLHLLEDLPEGLQEFEQFYARRRAALRGRISILLGSAANGTRIAQDERAAAVC